VVSVPGGGGGDTGDHTVRLTAWVDGLVQGVGFRWWVRAHARGLGLTGTVENLPDGRVKVVAEGDQRTCRELLALLNGPGTPGRVSEVKAEWSQAQGDSYAFTSL
jgi:acylphosphatase